MSRKISLSVASITIVVSIAYPLLTYNGNDLFFMPKVVGSIVVFSLFISVLFALTFYLKKKRGKKTIYLAYNFSEMEFVNELKSSLSALHYTCVPDLKRLVSGSKIKDLNISSQIDIADMLLVILSDTPSEPNYINLIARYFKKANKPIQIYSFAERENIPSSLKQYMVFPLPHDKNSAISMILCLVNELFQEKNSKGNLM